MKILVVVHNYVGLGKIFGGVELTVREILEAASADSAAANQYYLLSYDQRQKPVSDGNYVLLDMSRRNENNVIGQEIETFQIPQSLSLDCYHDNAFAYRFRDIIRRYGIDIVHFHHLLHFPLDAPLIAQQAGAATVLSLHDYYALCPQWNLLRNHKTFCGFPDGVTLDTCDKCLYETYGYPPGNQKRRRRLLSEILEMADALQYQSRDERDRFFSCYPALAEKETLVIGSPLVQKPFTKGGTTLPLKVLRQSPPETSDAEDTTAPFAPAQPLKVVCLGNISPEKGGDALVEVIRQCGAGTRARKFQFHLYGDVRPPYDSLLAPLSKSGDAVIHGKYDSGTLFEQLEANNGVTLFGSNWPETWVRTLSESVACGLVPIAPRVGAFIERISDGVNGMLYENASVNSMIHALDKAVENPEMLERLRQNLPSIDCPTVEDNIAAFDALYTRVREKGTAPEYAQHRAALLDQIGQSPRPVHWTSETPTVLISTESPGIENVPDAPYARPSLVQRVIGVARRRGFRYLIWAAFNHLKNRRV